MGIREEHVLQELPMDGVVVPQPLLQALQQPPGLYQSQRKQTPPVMRIHSIEEREKLRQLMRKDRVYDGAYDDFTCLGLVLTAYACGALGRIFPPFSIVLGFLMRSKDCDVRAAACNALRWVWLPSKFSVRAAEACLYDPAGNVERAVMNTLPSLGPKHVSVDSYITLVLKRCSNVESVTEKIASHYSDSPMRHLLGDLDKILQIVSQLQVNDPFFGTLIEKLVTSPSSDTWKAVELLYNYVADTSELETEGRSSRAASKRRLIALGGLRRAVRIFFHAKGFTEEFQQLRNDLSLILLGESDENLLKELDRLLSDIDEVLEV